MSAVTCVSRVLRADDLLKTYGEIELCSRPSTPSLETFQMTEIASVYQYTYHTSSIEKFQ